MGRTVSGYFTRREYSLPHVNPATPVVVPKSAYFDQLIILVYPFSVDG